MEDSNVVRLLSAGADQILAAQAPDEILATYTHTLVNRYTLLNNLERVLSEAQIYEGVWNSDKDFHSSIARPIHRLRQKIELDQRNPLYICSVRGAGYQFMPSPITSCDI